jgi:hypothetical protein
MLPKPSPTLVTGGSNRGALQQRPARDRWMIVWGHLCLAHFDNKKIMRY